MLDYEHCTLCPRQCGVDRLVRRGACGETAEVRIARAALHFWEEPPISGQRGSGTVFFTGCNLGCVYCQNRTISRAGEKAGASVTPAQLAEEFFRLEEQGAHNINLVTPTHFSPSIYQAVMLYRARGGKLPIVYNTSGYERPEIIEELQDTVDIYLTDLKYAESASAQKYSNAPDYPTVARRALEKMAETVGEPRYDDEGMLQKGVVVRLLVLPGLEVEAMLNLKYLWQTFGDRVIVSLMNQYTPVGEDLPLELRQPLPKASYQTVVNYAVKLGYAKAFIQADETAEESFIPAFGEGEIIR